MRVSSYQDLFWPVAAFVASICLAAGHHVFYARLDGKQTPDSVSLRLGSSYSLSTQQKNIVIGTLFAVLIKGLVHYAMSTTHTQTAWMTVTTRKTTCGAIDAGLRATSDFLCLLKWTLWRRNPLMMLLALLFWLLPVMSFFPPSALTIQSKSQVSVSNQSVPTLDFNTTSYANLQYTTDAVSQSSQTYHGPTTDVDRTVTSSLLGWDIVDIAPPAANSSWQREFPGPAMSCSNVSDAGLYDNITSNIKGQVTSLTGSNQGYTSIDYISWIPSDQSVPDDMLPYDPNSTSPPRKGPFTHVSSAYGVMSLFVAAVHEYNSDKSVKSATILQCVVQNTSYVVNFKYVNGAQSIHASTAIPQNNVTWNLSIAQAENAPADLNSPSIHQSLSYAAILDSFSKMLVGDISRNQGVVQSGTTDNSSVTNTALMKTNELKFIDSLGSTDARPLIPLADAIEDAFRNATVSLMSSPGLQPNYSDSTQHPTPQDTVVTFTTYENTYSYNYITLWVPYIVGLVLALICLVQGLWSAYRNGGSYETKFSTVLRMSKGIVLSDDINEKDTSGIEPTPRYIENLDVTFPQSGAGSNNSLLPKDA